MRLLILVLFCIGLSSVFGQGATFVASANAKQVTSQSVFQVTFTLQNGQGRDFRPPDFKGFDFVSGPAQSRSTSIINGTMTQSMSFAYSLMRIKPGTYTIEPASIKVGSQTLTTKPLTIEIVKGKPTAPGVNSSENYDVLLRAMLGSNTAYPGQQVLLNYKIYTTVNVRNYNTLREDDYTQFYYRYVQNFNNRAQLEVVDGVQYTVQTIKSIALFPQQSGTFGIAPMVATLGVAVKDEHPGFLFGTRTTPVNVASDSITLAVLPLPAGAPASFTGAVGKYTMQARINKQQLSTDDALVLTLDISGDGDAKRWSPPDLSYLKTDYELYDPKILMDESADNNGIVRHRRMIEYLMVPREPGNRELQLDFSFFDPDSVQYRTLTTPAFQLVVSQGSRVSRGEPSYSGDATSSEVRGLKPLRAGNQFILLFSPYYFLLLIAPLFFLGRAWVKRRNEDQFESLDKVEKKRRRARKIAETHLQEAQKMLNGSERQFYESLSRAIFSYLSAKLNIPASEFTKTNLATQLERLNWAPALREEFLKILKTSEEVLYAGSAGHTDRQQFYERTRDLIEQAESLG